MINGFSSESSNHGQIPDGAIPPVLSECDSPRSGIAISNPVEQNVGSDLDLAGAPSRTLAIRLFRRIVFILFLAGLMIGVAVATSPRPKLLKTAEELPKSADLSVENAARVIDSEIDTDLARNGLKAADPADWMTLCRRLSLALVGNGLSLEEIRFLETIPEAQRVDWWIGYLLRDKRSADYLAERWTRATVGTNQGPFLIFRRRKYVQWLSNQIAENRPYDELVRELLTAKGSWTDAPEVNFLTATMDDNDNRQPDVIRLAGRTSRSFLAQRIDCLQCHRDYLGNVHFTDNLVKKDPKADGDSIQSNSSESITAEGDSSESLRKDNSEGIDSSVREGEQEDFHQLASFFAGVRMDNPFVGLRNTDHEYHYRYLDADDDSLVSPKVPYLSQLLPQAGSPRERLAHWVTHPENKAFARAAVNRVWAILFGKPWITPIDSIPLQGPFPPGFEAAAEDFTRSGYDLQRLIRVLAKTQAFHRDSRKNDESVTENDEKHWGVFPLTQLRPEQVAATIHQASRLKTIDENSSIISKLELFGGINDFTKAYGDKGDDEFSENAITIPQRLLVMNGDYIQQRIKNDPIQNAASKIAQLTKEDRKAVIVSYLAVLNRKPTSEELESFCERIASHDQGRKVAIEDLYWTLMNSTEFLWNH